MNRSRPSNAKLDDRGSSTLEFAMFAVGAVMLLLAGTDLVSYLRTRMRLDEVAGTVANRVTTFQTLYRGDFPALFADAQQMAGSVAVGGNDGATVVTGIANRDGTVKVEWQERTGNAAFVSAFGTKGASPTNLPDSYALPKGSTVVAVEVFSSVHPWVLSRSVMGGSGPPTLRSAALFQPRLSLLSSISEGNRP